MDFDSGYCKIKIAINVWNAKHQLLVLIVSDLIISSAKMHLFYYRSQLRSPKMQKIQWETVKHAKFLLEMYENTVQMNIWLFRRLFNHAIRFEAQQFQRFY